MAESYVQLPDDSANTGKLIRSRTRVVSGNTVHEHMFQHAEAAAATLTNVTASASNGTLLASNTSRRGALIYNDADKVLYLKFGATASTSSFTVAIAANAYYEMPFPIYQGQVDGIWATGPTGAARITELT